MVKQISYLMLVAAIGLQACGGSDSGDKDDGGNGDEVFTALDAKYRGEWLRSDLNGATTSNMCDEDYDADGTGNTGSQEALLIISASESANSLSYEWKVFVDSDACSGSATTTFNDRMEFTDVKSVAETANTITLSAKVSRLFRGVPSVLTASALNGFNTSLGACGKTNWAVGEINSSEFVGGCEALVGEDGMDDYKFSGQSLSDVIYWRVTYVDANNLSVETSTDNITFDSPDTYKK